MTESDLNPLLDALGELTEHSVEPGGAIDALLGLGELPPFLRSLLVADGTVTLALEAYFGETIRIVTLRQGAVRLSSSLSVLCMPQGATGYFREVELRGESTGEVYAHASSILNKRAIPGSLFDALVDERVGIGVILRNSAKGSFREVLRVATGGLMTDFDVNRTYRVSLGGVPSILITEEFPISIFL